LLLIIQQRQVPSLIDAMRSSGLIVGVHGCSATIDSLTDEDHDPIDAFISEEALVSFLNHSTTQE